MTDRCNLACNYCYQDRTGKGRLSWELAEKAVRLAFKDLDPRLKIYFYGGEPALEWEKICKTIDLVRSLQKRRVKEVCFSMTSNGLLLTDEKLEYLNSVSMEILLSFDGTREAHEAGRGSKTFEKTRVILEKIRQYPQIQLNLNAVVHPRNIQYLEQSVKFISSLGVRHCDFVIDSIHSWSQEQLREMARQFRSLFVRCSQEVMEGQPISFPRFTLGSFGKPYQCKGVRGSWVVTPEGKIFDCVMRTPKWTFGKQEEFERFVLGDLCDGLKRMPGPEAAARLDTLPQTVDHSHRRSGPFKCSDCRYLNRCAICPSVCVQGTGDFLEVPRAHCIYTKLSCYYTDRLAAMGSSPQMTAGAASYQAAAEI